MADDEGDNNRGITTEGEDEKEGIPGIASLPSSASETEEERRRILEGIFAEEDDYDEEDDEIADDDSGSGGPGVGAFWGAAGGGSGSRAGGRLGRLEEEEDVEAGDDGVEDGAEDDASGGPTAAIVPPAEESPQAPAAAPWSRPQEPPRQQPSALLPEALTTKRRIISEDAFSSSSDDESFGGAAASPGGYEREALAAGPPRRFGFDYESEEPPMAQRQQRPQQPDLMDGSNDVQFSWIGSSHSHESGNDDDDGAAFDVDAAADALRRGGEEGRAALAAAARRGDSQASLPFTYSQDTVSIQGSVQGGRGRRSPPSAMALAAAGAGNDGGNADDATNSVVEDNDEDDGKNVSAADAAARGDPRKDPPPSSARPSQQHRPRSAFDRALDEARQRDAPRSARPLMRRPDSFAPPDAPPEAKADEEEGDDDDVKDMGSNVGIDVGVADPESTTAPPSADEGGSGGAKDDEDFLARADNTVLDEILSEHPEEGEAMASEDHPSPPPGKSPPSESGTRTTEKGSSEPRVKDRISLHAGANSGGGGRRKAPSPPTTSARSDDGGRDDDASQPSAGGLPDVLGAVRQKIESLNLFDADPSSAGVPPGRPSVSGPPLRATDLTHASDPRRPPVAPFLAADGSALAAPAALRRYYDSEEERESMRRAFQQSISAAVLVSLAHKRYERRRLAAMEIEKVVRSLVVQGDYGRVRAILLLLGDDYVRSTNEDARKGGAVALAACAIGLKKADEGRGDVAGCRDLILASVVHACQDHSQRVRYYATESLFNVTKVIPSLAVQHFFILFEILRSLFADVDLDVRSGAELLDKKLKEVIVGAINSGSFSADACVPVFARFVHMRNKATKQLTLTWLKEFSDKLIGAPMLQFLHLFLGGIFSMVADPNAAIRQLALEFLQSVLPKLLANNEDFEDGAAQQRADFDRILQSLVLTMEHPDPFVRKVAMYWMSRIVQAHMSSAFPNADRSLPDDPDDPSSKGVSGTLGSDPVKAAATRRVGGTGGDGAISAASVSVRNALPHVLPGILLSVGDTHQSRTAKDSFLPDQTAHSLAEQANVCLQDAVRRDGQAFVPHLGGFIVALREELDSPGGLLARNPPSLERRPYRMDVKADGSGIESTGWFRASDGVEERDNALILSRLCALQWVVVLYESVVPDSLKADYASEFIDCIIYQLVDQPPGIILAKSFEVLARISNPAEGEKAYSLLTSSLSMKEEVDASALLDEAEIPSKLNPMTDESANFALGILQPSQRKLLSRDRSVFASLIDLHSKHQKLLQDISKVIELMCTLQPPEFVYVSFAIELDNFIVSRMKHREKMLESPEVDVQTIKKELASFAKDLAFVSNFAQQLSIVFFAAPETEQLRGVLKDSIGFKGETIRDERRARLFHILLYTLSHNIVAALSFCLWGGAFLTASKFLNKIDPLDVSLMFYLEIDSLIDLIERPLFRHLHLRMLECEDDPYLEGSGAMLFRTLKSIMMLLPQSTSYNILKERLTSMARYRQSAVALNGTSKQTDPGTDIFVSRIVNARRLHCDAKWRNIRAESLQEPNREVSDDQKLSAAQQRREWLGYANEEEELATKERMKQNLLGDTPKKAEVIGAYENLNEVEAPKLTEYKEDSNEECEVCVTSPTQGLIMKFEQMGALNEGKDDGSKPQWREYWASRHE